MKEKLLIVESPAKAKTIEQYLGKGYTVISSYGHVRGILSEKGAIDPDNNFTIKYSTNPKSSKYIDIIINNAKRANEIYLATDPDREGEAISWHIEQILKEKNAIKKDTKIERIVFHEITPDAIKNAIKNGRDINMDLVHAQQSRQALDYLVGFTLSPILWRKLPGSRSAGRVQSVALRMICDREAEIEKFKIDEFWSIHGRFESMDKITKTKKKFITNLTIFEHKKLDKLAIKNAQEADKIIAELNNHTYKIIKLDKKEVSKSPQPPFTTSTLLQESARKLGFSAKKTAQTAQKLYEGINISGKLTGLITYMRTDSVYINPDVANDINKMIKELYGKEFAPTSPRQYKTKVKNAQEAHEAIRPTNPRLIPNNIKNYLTNDEYELYSLIWKRTIASQMSNVIMERTTIDIANESNDNIKIKTTDVTKAKNKSSSKSSSGELNYINFHASGSTIKFQGFYKVYREDQDDYDNKSHDGDEGTQILPTLELDQKSDLLSVEKEQHFTQPPPRYNEAGLIKNMEALGIGRPSTYPTIISILKEREYADYKTRKFIPSEKGRLVNAFLVNFFTHYVEYDFTANMEESLDQISHGKLDYMKALKDFWTPFKGRADEVMALQTPVILNKVQDYLTDYIYGYDPNEVKDVSEEKFIENAKKCNVCGTGIMELKNSKFGAFLGCSNYPECKATRRIGGEIEGDNTNTKDSSADVSKYQSKIAIVLGHDPKDGCEVSINKGPYGFYVMKKLTTNQEKEEKEHKDAANNVQKNKKVVKNAKYKEQRKIVGLPKSKSYTEVDLNYALKLLNLPLVLCKHPDGSDIRVGIGRFGPYIEHNKKYVSLKREDFMEIKCDEAIELIDTKEAKTPKTKKNSNGNTSKADKKVKTTKKLKK